MGLDMNMYATSGEDLTEQVDDSVWDAYESWYWRKANSIHNWMVENVQNGTDDCGVYEVTLSQVHELRNIVEEVLRDPEKGPELLPTVTGFFFGDTSYGPWYLEDLELTRSHIIEMLEQSKLGETRFFYASSW
jgi:hypothetical protein